VDLLSNGDDNNTESLNENEKMVEFGFDPILHIILFCTPNSWAMLVFVPLFRAQHNGTPKLWAGITSMLVSETRWTNKSKY
jgi:hypothetical protein